MSVMFWVWLGIIVVTGLLEIATAEVVSIWFTLGAIIPFILSAVTNIDWQYQVLIFIIISAFLIVTLRGITKKWLTKNLNTKTNLDSIIGKTVRMLDKTDFETVGSVKINGVVWSAIGEHDQLIEKDSLVEIVKVDGNKLVVRQVKDLSKAIQE